MIQPLSIQGKIDNTHRNCIYFSLNTQGLDWNTIGLGIIISTLACLFCLYQWDLRYIAALQGWQMSPGQELPWQIQIGMQDYQMGWLLVRYRECKNMILTLVQSISPDKELKLIHFLICCQNFPLTCQILNMISIPRISWKQSYKTIWANRANFVMM